MYNPKTKAGPQVEEALALLAGAPVHSMLIKGVR